MATVFVTGRIRAYRLSRRDGYVRIATVEADEAVDVAAAFKTVGV